MYFFGVNLWIIIIEVLVLAARGERQQMDNDGPISAPGQRINNQREQISSRNIDVSLTAIVEKDDKLDKRRRGDILEMVASLSGSSKTKVDWLAEYRGQLPTRMSSIESNYNGKLGNFDWHLNLDEAKRYWLDWRVEYEANKIVLSLSIDRKASNFRQGSDIFALGFSNYGELNSSDFCFIWYDLSHKIHLQDARTNSENRLELIDTSESVCKLLRASEDHSKGFARREPYDSRTYRTKDDDVDGGGDNDKSKLSEEKDNSKRLRQEEEEAEVDNESQIRIVFKRPLDVCSSDNYYTIDNGTTHLVWFTLRGPLLTIDGLNLSDFINDLSSPSQKSSAKSDHQFEYGMKRVQLIATKAAGPKFTENNLKQTINFISNHHHNRQHQALAEFKMDNFQIPAEETLYWCKLFKLDSNFESRRYHITKYEAIIDDGNEHIVHHMELFNCANLNTKQELDLKDLYENKGGWSGDCNSLKRPKETEPCRRVILAWAMGAHPLEYPEEVGQSIGGYKYSPYVVLEIHYNNVKFTPNLVDNSGLRFEYTSKLRPYDSGILEVGLEYTEKNSIPPNMITPIAGYCVSECTRGAMSYPLSSSTSLLSRANGEKQQKRKQKQLQRHKMSSNNTEKKNGNENENNLDETSAINNSAHSPKIQIMNDYDNLKDGIYIFAAQMHTHLAGIASWTEHIREGRLLNELQRDNHYSPHFQEIRLLPKPVHVAPGDALIHYCLYDTTKRRNITLGGYSTSEEMCVTYLHYYPKIDLEVCKSSVDTKALEAYFAYLAREEKQNTSLRLKELSMSSESNSASSLNWNWNWNSDEKYGKNENNNDKHLTEKGRSSTCSSIEAKSISENYNSIEWSARRSRELIQFYSQAPLSIQCNRSNGERFPGYWNGIPASQLWTTEQSLAAHDSSLLPFTRTDPDNFKLVGYRGSSQFNRRHTHC